MFNRSNMFSSSLSQINMHPNVALSQYSGNQNNGPKSSYCQQQILQRKTVNMDKSQSSYSNSFSAFPTQQDSQFCLNQKKKLLTEEIFR